MNVEELLRLLVDRGGAAYGGEPVTQLDHALQCAHLADRAGEPPSLVAAALLHDIGHLVDGADVGRIDDGEDDRHEFRGLPFLRRWFGPGVIEPIRLHVAAKRYLCAMQPGYWDSLSDASRKSLQAQGGTYTTRQAEAFAARPYSREALRLRRYDDLAKDPAITVPAADSYLGILRQASLGD